MRTQQTNLAIRHEIAVNCRKGDDQYNILWECLTLYGSIVHGNKHLVKKIADHLLIGDPQQIRTSGEQLFVRRSPLLWGTPEARKDQITHRQQFFGQAIVELDKQLLVQQNLLLPFR
jgi:hypothetical protein